MNNKLVNSILSLAAAVLCGGIGHADSIPLGTAFTYQGRLVATNGPVSGTYELAFKLWDAPAGGTQLGPTNHWGPNSVSAGLLTATLDFGSVFSGNLRYLEILARTNGSSAWTTFPRQPLTPAPNAINALGVAGGQEPDNNTGGRPVTVMGGHASPTGIPFVAVPGGDVILQGGNGFDYNFIDPVYHGGHVVLRSGANWIQAIDPAVDGGDIIFQTGAATNSFIERARILGRNGNVGIAKTNPATALDVAGTITATAFAGNGAGLANLSAPSLTGSVPAATLTAVPAVNLTGTVADARLSANVALVNAHQVFTGTNRFTGPIVATNPASQFAGTFTGNGGALTNLSASSLSGSVPAAALTSVPAGSLTGTVADARLSANVALLNASQVFTGTNRFASPVLATNVAGGQEPDNNTGGRPVTVVGGHASPTGIPFVAVPGGDVILQGGNGFDYDFIDPVYHGGHVVLRSGANWIQAIDPAVDGGDIIFQTGAATNSFIERARILGRNGNVGIAKTNPATALDVAGTITATAFAGNGAGLINVNATNLTGSVPAATLTSVPASSLTGTVADARLSANVALLNTSPTFAGNLAAAKFTGNGAGLTNLNATNLTGTVPAAALTSVPAGSLTGTVADARLSANVALVNADQIFTGTNRFASPVLATTVAGDAPADIYSFGRGIAIQAGSANNPSGWAVGGGGLLLQAGNGFNSDFVAPLYHGGNVVLRSGANWLQAVDPSLDGGDIVFETGGATNSFTERARIVGSNGYLGIGTTAPGANLHVKSTGWPTAMIESSSANGTWFSLKNTTAGGAEWYLISTGSGLPEGAGKLILHNGAPQMTLDASGNVAIGTSHTSPSAKLDVAGDIKSNSKSVAVGEESLRIVRGVVSSNGIALKGTGFTVVSNNIGAFTIRFATAFADVPTVTATAAVPPPGTQADVAACMLMSNTVSYVTVSPRNSGGSGVNRDFHFIAVGPR